jgi:hypothetical protein
MNMNNNYNLGKLLLAQFLSCFKHNIEETLSAHFPPSIGEYRFVRRIPKIGDKESSLIGLYENKQSQKAIAKLISNKKKNYHYFSLKNEITLYGVLNQTIQSIGKKMPAKFRIIKIPHLLAIHEDNEVLVMLTSFCEGKPATELATHRKTKLFFLISNYLNFLGRQIEPNLRSAISLRTKADLFRLYPFLLVKAIYNFPRLTPLFLQGISRVYRNWGAFSPSIELVLVHRDLHFRNILYHQKHYIILEFQQCVFTDPLQEYVTIIRYYWHQDKISQQILTELIKNSQQIPNFVERMRWLSVQSVTHGLIDKNFTPKTISGWVKFLQYSLHPDSFKTESIENAWDNGVI